jgi:hypothetical protein
MFSKVLRLDYAPQKLSMAINSGDIVWVSMNTYGTGRLVTMAICVKFRNEKETFKITERSPANFTELEMTYLDFFTRWSNHNDLLVEMNE